MTPSRPATLLLILGLLLGGVLAAQADTWAPPSTKTYLASNGGTRITIVPRKLSGALAYFEDKTDGKEAAGQDRGSLARSPVARAERLQADGSWKLLWVRTLVNDVAPPTALVAKDGDFLVTFDNWHSAGYGDDVVVIYDRKGELVRKLSLEQILPAAYVHHLPRSVSSRWWGGQHRLVEGDQFVELQVVEPGAGMDAEPKRVPVRIRLADGRVLPPSGPAWDAALAKAHALEAERMAAWQALRTMRSSPLRAPTSQDTKAWRHYLFEIRDRVAGDEERMGGMVLAARGNEKGFHDAESIAREIAGYDASEKYRHDAWIFTSPTSGRLADILVKALEKRAPGSMASFHLVFVGTAADGQRVERAAQRSAAKVTRVDSEHPVPPGKPLPEVPPELWMPPPAWM